ncbi:MAG: flagellar basal body L-ring protein FlgH [Desulfovibrio sp.]|jgi:flagellar L-ring protein precursor FlgH|nr:flagellar basal body L-ring protein FlgH [Desulfovibrio sp.]
MRKILVPFLLLGGAALSGCNGQNYSAAPMRPMVPAQVYTEPEQIADNPGSLFSLAESQDLYADNRARRVGDIVMVKIVENAKSKSKVDTTANRETTNSLGISAAFGRSSVGLGPLKGAVGTNPLLATSSTSELQSTGETKRENYVTATIGARVLQVLPGGLLQLQGAREVRVNEETQYMVVSGIVRAKDVASDNSVESTQLADSRIEYYGKGVLADKQKSGWLTRLLDNVWPF